MSHNIYNESQHLQQVTTSQLSHNISKKPPYLLCVPNHLITYLTFKKIRMNEMQEEEVMAMESILQESFLFIKEDHTGILTIKPGHAH